ncbi:MAG: hypothetical protein EOO68_26415 [Moraxellaceae bacterium]|nr:MAG: hypothetical protein EOO68_26415 [Moraxellaceae bacterium]
MQRILNHKTLAFATLIIWLLASWSGAHGHMCFDGQEPPITVHIHVSGEHADHDSSQNHLDADVDIGQSAPTNFFKIDFSILLAVAFSLAIRSIKPLRIIVDYICNIPFRLMGLRPPLRAPPVHPA